jgi:hypothetical protein
VTRVVIPIGNSQLFTRPMSLDLFPAAVIRVGVEMSVGMGQVLADSNLEDKTRLIFTFAKAETFANRREMTGEKDLMNIIWADLLLEVNLVEMLYKNERNPTHARLVVRTLFSAIEALCSIAANAAWFPVETKVLEEAKQSGISFQVERDVFALTSLRFQQFEIDDAGEVKQKKPKVNFHRQLLFVIKTVSKLHSVLFNPKHEEGWESLAIATRVRDRITHPKTGTDLHVTHEEIEHSGKAVHWFLACMRKAQGLPPKKFAGSFE